METNLETPRWKQILILVEPEFKKQLDEFMESKGMKVSPLTRRLLAEYMSQVSKNDLENKNRI